MSASTPRGVNVGQKRGGGRYNNNNNDDEMKRIRLLKKMEKEHHVELENEREEEEEEEKEDYSLTASDSDNDEKLYNDYDDDDGKYANQMNIPKNDKPNIPSNEGFRMFTEVEFLDDGSMKITYEDTDSKIKTVVFESASKNYVFTKLVAGKKTSVMVKGEKMAHKYINLINSMFFRFSTTLVYTSDDGQVYTSLKRSDIGCIAQIVDFFSKKHKTSAKYCENAFISCGMILQGDNFRDDENEPIETLVPYINKYLDLLVTIDFTLFTHKSPRDGDAVYLACKPKLTVGKIRPAVIAFPNF